MINFQIISPLGNLFHKLVLCPPAHMLIFAPSPRGDFIFWVTRTRNAKPSAARDPCPHQAPARTNGKD